VGETTIPDEDWGAVAYEPKGLVGHLHERSPPKVNLGEREGVLRNPP